MGKKSKICKVGNSKKNYGNVLKIKKEKLRNLQNIANKMKISQGLTDKEKKPNSQDDSSEYFSEDDMNTTKLNKTNLNTTFANHDRTNLYDSLININQTTDKVNLTQLNQTFLNYARQNNLNRTKLHHTMADFALQPGEVPLRNRRIKDNTFLSKGQKKRLEKKEKVLKKKLLDEVLRKNRSLIIDTKSQLNKTNLNMMNINLNITNNMNNNDMMIEGDFGNKKTELNKTVRNNINDNDKKVHIKKNEFDLLEMNSTLNNMLKDIKQQDNNLEVEKKTIELTKRKKQNVKRLLYKFFLKKYF